MENKVSIKLEKPSKIYITDMENHSGIMIDLKDISFKDKCRLWNFIECSIVEDIGDFRDGKIQKLL